MCCKLANVMKRPDNRQWPPFWLSDCQENNRLDRLSLHDSVGRIGGLLASDLATFGNGCEEDFEHVSSLVSKGIKGCSRNRFREHQNSFWIRESTLKFFEFQFPFHYHFFTFEANRVDRLNDTCRSCKDGRYRPYECNHN